MSIVLQTTPHTIAMPGAQLFVQEIGQGAPILFLHGNPDSGDLWHPVIERLQADYRCIAPDLPGFGRSTADGNFDLSLENRGHFVETVVNGLGIDEPVTLVLHDHGAPFGLAWAVSNPEKVRGIVLINALLLRPDYVWHFWGQVWRTPILGELHTAVARIPGMMALFMLLETRLHGGSRLPWSHIQHTASLFKPSVGRMMLRLYRASTPSIFRGWEDRMNQLPKSVPVRVVWGKRDPYLPHSFPQDLEKHGAVVRYLDNCGHFPMVEAPQIVAEEIRQMMSHAPHP
ncbi:MAG: alpha/beta hydrolase [bacterium]|nr:alpha/beta hydrolase [bacterium]